MPIGIQRLNARKSQPNNLIIFIKPLKGPDEAIARDLLERIAAQCLPVMKEHHISVMSLEEFEPNREFVGRNFNAGEVIQLVLKSASTGRWLPFNYVQMVMMHELAHCKQMNHSRAFWAVRNKYAEQMRALWTEGYTGEGLWGRGALLTTGEFEANTTRPDEALPEHLCGGTYRSRRRKRKTKEQLTYQQRKERRILKKFGANGVALGKDDEIKAELEKGKRVQSKPRVANSKRGRELRAAAALARFGKQNKGEEDMKEEDLKKEDVKKEDVKKEDVKKEELVKAEDETANEEDFETASETDDEAAGATDINGRKLLDGKGNRLIKVCEDENPQDADAQQELRELQSSMTTAYPASGLASASSQTKTVKLEDEDDHARDGLQSIGSPAKLATPSARKSTADPEHCYIKPEPEEWSGASRETNVADRPTSRTTRGAKVGRHATEQGERGDPDGRAGTGVVCPMCSFENGLICLTCTICSHLLDDRKDPQAWRCDKAPCRDSRYLNAGDAGVCGLCGERKPT